MHRATQAAAGAHGPLGGRQQPLQVSWAAACGPGTGCCCLIDAKLAALSVCVQARVPSATCAVAATCTRPPRPGAAGTARST